MELKESYASWQPRKVNEILSESFSNLEERRSNKGINGIPSGFIGLDRITGGWQNQELVIIAARPAMGKSAFALSCARNSCIDFQKPTVIFSLETSALKLANRLISGEAEVDFNKINGGNLSEWEWQQLHNKIGRLIEAPLIIDDTPSLDISDLREKCTKLKIEEDIKIVVIDNLQLLKDKKSNNKASNREQEIGNISRELKSIARELDITIIALSQLSRAVESRPGLQGKRPMLSDLRESGSIEQDADMVLFLYRPEYYGITEDEQGRSQAGIGEIIIAKHRNGETGIVPLRFIGKFVKFTDLEEDFNSPILGSGDSSAGITPSQSSDNFNNPRPQGNTIIMPSRGNNMHDDDDPPF